MSHSTKELTPREIVAELDRHIVGQHDAKRAVAIAVRNRWRRQRVDDSLKKEIAPKNIMMIGPTGVGKTEIARRLATLTGAPFLKVEATKYTEVGYYGRDVESMVRELVENSITIVRDTEREKIKTQATEKVEEQLVDMLLQQQLAAAAQNKEADGSSKSKLRRPTSSSSSSPSFTASTPSLGNFPLPTPEDLQNIFKFFRASLNGEKITLEDETDKFFSKMRRLAEERARQMAKDENDENEEDDENEDDDDDEDMKRTRAIDRFLDLRIAEHREGEKERLAEEEKESLAEEENRNQMRENIRLSLRAGEMEDQTITLTTETRAVPVMMGTFPGMDLDLNLEEMFEKIIPKQTAKRELTVKDAREFLFEQECDRLINREKMHQAAIELAENFGIIFIDEMDKIVASDKQHGADVSRQGVQRDLLPIVEGTTIQTKFGYVKTDHVLFIAAGAFHRSKPSDLMPELQGRFPIRVELKDLSKEDFIRILTEPRGALTKQYTALMATEGVTVEFTEDAVESLAGYAFEVNQKSQNIGARRLYTIMERLLEELSFEAPDMKMGTVTINASYVKQRLDEIAADEDLNRFIL